MNRLVRPRGRRRALPWLAAALGASLIATACGSSLSEQEKARSLGAPMTVTGAGAGAVAGIASADAGSPPAAGSVPGQASGAAAAAVPAASAPAGAVTPSPKNADRAVAVAAGGGGSAVPTSRQAAAPAAGNAAPTGEAASPGMPGQPGPGVAPPPRAAGPGSELRLGSIGTESGVIGNIVAPWTAAVRIWAADVNARGGLDGRPVKLVVADDGGDPNKAVSLARRMIDEDKVVAFYGNHSPTTEAAINPLLEQRKIPSISGCFCDKDNARSPMQFTVGIGAEEGLAYSHSLPLRIFAPDKKKVSLINCREVAICQILAKRIKEHAGSIGLQIVHEAQATLSQPDYTAEVLAARNAGADAMIVILDNFSVIRVARSAHRQGYDPVVSSQGTLHDSRFLRDGGEDVEGILIGGFMPPWDGGLLSDYRAAVKRYNPNAPLGDMGTIAWAAGKLIEKIGPALPATPTSADLLKALYAVDGETLGGLTPPLGYLEGQPTEKANHCIIPYRVEGGKYVTPSPDTYVCAPGWQPVKNGAGARNWKPFSA